MLLLDIRRNRGLILWFWAAQRRQKLAIRTLESGSGPFPATALRGWVLRGWWLRGWLLPRDCFGVRCGVIHHFLTQNVCSNRLQGIRISQFLKLPSAACRGRLLSKFNSCDSWINTDGNDSSNRNFSSRSLSCNNFAGVMTD